MSSLLRWGTQQLRPECSTIDEQGTVRIRLAVSWEGWFRFLTRLPDALYLTRSAIAVQGAVQAGPPMTRSAQLPIVTTPCGLFSANLSEYGCIEAVRETTPEGPRYLLEVTDNCGQQTQRIVLPPYDDCGDFASFVACYQATPEELSSWFPPNNKNSTKRLQKLAQRIPHLRSGLVQQTRSVQPLNWSTLDSILIAAIHREMPMRTTVYNRTIINSSIWTPIKRETERSTKTGSAIHYFGAEAGIELTPDPKASLWLWTGRCKCCDDQRWAIEVGDSNDRLGLALHSPTPSREIQWRQFLTDTIGL